MEVLPVGLNLPPATGAVVGDHGFEEVQERLLVDRLVLAHLNALVADPATLRQLRAQWAGKPLPPEPETVTRDPNAPPSAGRNISPPRQPLGRK